MLAAAPIEDEAHRWSKRFWLEADDLKKLVQVDQHDLSFHEAAARSFRKVFKSD
jgi:hypothetical protein